MELTTDVAVPPVRAHSAQVSLTGHLPALDGVRGLAILMVLAVHFIGDMRADTRVEQVLVQGAMYGTLGVDLFFVLSGFLITGILLDAKRRPHFFRTFYLRRVLRIFPLYYAVLAVGLLVLPRLIESPSLELARAHQGWLWAYGANIFIGQQGDWEVLAMFGHFWSLAVEEHFYFVWPVVVFALSAKQLKSVALICVVGAVAFRVALHLAGVNNVALYTWTPGRIDTLCMGALMAIISREPDGIERLRRWAPKVLLGSLLFVASTFVLTRVWVEGRVGMHLLRETAFGLGLSSVLWLALTGPRALTATFTSAPLRFFGRYSYGLYVFHYLFGYFLIRAHTEDVVAKWVGSHTLALVVQAVLATLAAVALAMLSFHVFEKPFLKLKAKV